MTKTIKLNTVEDIQRLNHVATDEHYDMSVSCGHIMIDAKSLLALFSLIGREVTLVAPDDISVKHFHKTIKRMKLSTAV